MITHGLLFTILLSTLPLSKCDYPFRNVKLPWHERVDDLVSRLTIHELMLQLAMGGGGPRGGPAPSIPRLKIGKYSWGTECLRGDAVAGEATAFPQSIGLAATFSPKLIHAIAEATAKEVRAKYNNYTKTGQYGDHKGISCFSPVINIMRHPLWGRNQVLFNSMLQWMYSPDKNLHKRTQETYGEDPYMNGLYAANFVWGLQGTESRYIRANAGCKHFDAYAGPENIPTSRLSFDAKETYGEDPYLSGQYARQFVTGLQGDHFRYVRASAGCKHFDVHGGPENIPVSRFSFDSKVAERDWRLTFLPAFQACVKAGTYSLMCSYNRINGIPACANKQLLTSVLRKEWGFSGYVISDEEAVENIVLYHHYVNTSMEATIAVLEAGLNIELTTSRKDPYFFTIGTVSVNGIPACANHKLLTEILRAEWGFEGYIVSDEGALEFIILNHHYINNPLDTAVACLKAGCNLELSANNPLVYMNIACANHKLLTEILRAEWGFEGYIVSDEGALEFIILNHHYINNPLDTAVACLKAGCNLELSANNPLVYMNIEKAVQQGKLSEALVRERARPLFYTRMRLGEFDPPEMNPYSYYNLSLVQSPEHRALAVKAAIETFVLLKNNKLLPVKKHFDKIAVVGPMANNVNQLYGDYAADVDPRYVKTPYEGLKMMATTVNYAAGCPDNKCTNYSSSDIGKAIQGTQLVAVCVGTGQELESEGNDRSSMDLAGNQTDLITDAVKAAGADIPVVLLVFSAGPVNISFADRDPRVDAIIQCFFPAQATGEALYNMITSAEYSPAGRLPYTWYDTADQIPSMTNYSMEGRTYRYFKGKPLYPFGYGLSYSKFQYLNMSLIPVIQAGDAQYLYGEVMNIGDVDSDEVVQVYISWLSTREPMPQRQLVGFNRYYIKKDESIMFKFHINPEQLAVWTDRGWVVEPGEVQVYVGGQQPNQSRSVGSNVLSTKFKITGTKYLGKF